MVVGRFTVIFTSFYIIYSDSISFQGKKNHLSKKVLQDLQVYYLSITSMEKAEKIWKRVEKQLFIKELKELKSDLLFEMCLVYNNANTKSKNYPCVTPVTVKKKSESHKHSIEILWSLKAYLKTYLKKIMKTK